MKIVVCVKLSFPADQSVVIDSNGKWILDNSSGSLPYPGRYEELALEQALMIRDVIPGTTVDVITAGPASDSSVLRRALGMGANTGIHIITAEKGYIPALLTAQRLSGVIAAKYYDLILTGAMSEDTLQGLVGQMIAEMLRLSCVISSTNVSVSGEKNTVRIERDIEGARKQVLEMGLPGVVTVQGCPNKPRYPSLSNIMRANSQVLETIHAKDNPGMPGTESLVSLVYPEKARSVRFLEGTQTNKANKLASILRQKGFLS